jgi:hypothetical protein
LTVEYQGTRDIPLGDLTRFPGNPRKGNVAAIRKSVQHLTQYRSIVVRDTGAGLVILAGNHTADAIEAEGIPAARCDVITCTDDEARRIVAADNRTGELGSYDDQVLADLLAQIAGDDTGLGYAGTGWEDLAIPDEYGTTSGGASAADGDGPRQDSGAPQGPAEAPDAFPSYDDDIETAYQCPRCTYQWSGKPK